MKQIFVGTKVEENIHRAFNIRAAEAGLSKSALLNKLILELVGPVAAPARKKGGK